MTVSKIAEHNLERDREVLGKKWFSTYGGYFSDMENIQHFIDSVTPYLPDKELEILYAASASGLLGEELVKSLGRGNLTIVDVSEQHLSENRNPKTTKICADLLRLDLGKKFDLILMRSALDYFPSKELQLQVLQNIRKHLKDDGLFINQPAYIHDHHERDVVSKIYTDTEKIGDRLFQSSDIAELYLNAGFSEPERIGDGKCLVVTNKEHAERYGLSEEDVKNIQKMIGLGIGNQKVSKEGYALEFDFPIFLAKMV